MVVFWKWTIFQTPSRFTPMNEPRVRISGMVSPGIIGGANFIMATTTATLGAIDRTSTFSTAIGDFAKAIRWIASWPL